MENALVTVVIITYKRPIEILMRAVKSALSQTYENLQIIVVNDYPEDSENVAEIGNMLQQLRDDRIEYIVHERNMGACKARNTGIIHGKGAFIALLDDDDEWLPEKIEKQLKGFVSEQVGMVYSPFYNVTTTLPGTLSVRGTKSGRLTEELLWTNCIGGSSMPIMRSEVFDVCGLFDERLLSSQDYDMWLRISQSFEIVCINEPLTRRFLLEESITKNFVKQQQGFELFTEKHLELYKNNPKALNYRLNRRTNKYFENGHFSEAIKLYKRALRTRLVSKYNITEPLKGIIKFVFARKGETRK